MLLITDILHTEIMKKRNPEKLLEWLQSAPSLNELQSEFPEVWESVRQDVAKIVESGAAGDLQAYLKFSAAQGALLTKKLQKSPDKKNLADIVSQHVRNRVAYLVVKQHYISVATGIEKGKVKFNLINSLLAQFLLFSQGLERKPVSMFWFRLIWPLIRQKRLLMPLVQPEGIYCFYSMPLIDSLAAMIGLRPCLEIAAGDGSLTRFLAQKGVNIIATDDYSWSHEVKYPEWVVRQDAPEALKTYSPEVVICSWPPANNTFERQVFRSKKVGLYIVIGSRHHFAAGNWNEYNSQSSFRFCEDKRLNNLVLPPELDPAVYIFERKTD